MSMFRRFVDFDTDYSEYTISWQEESYCTVVIRTPNKVDIYSDHIIGILKTFDRLLEEIRKSRITMRELTDEEIMEANTFILGCVGDADLVRKAKLIAGKDPRKKITVEEIEYMQEENALLKMGNSRN